MSECLRPFALKKEQTTKAQLKQKGDIVPCGKCYECKLRRVNTWAFRLMQEEKISSSANFLTLTYNEENVPYASYAPTLWKPDLQNFFKRLRKLNKNKIKYYACGEYGSLGRPHYHIILFNHDVETIEDSWSLNDKPIGRFQLDECNEATIKYTVKYMQKKSVVFGEHDDRIKEFSLMSKGLGKNYLTSEMVKWHLSDVENRSIVKTYDNQTLPLPRYYRDKIFSEADKLKIKKANIERALNERDELAKYGKEKFYKTYDQNLLIRINKSRKNDKETRNTKF